jgi:hypothetical protein
MAEVAIQTETKASDGAGMARALMRHRATKEQRLEEIDAYLKMLRDFGNNPISLLDEKLKGFFFEVLTIIGKDARKLAGVK